MKDAVSHFQRQEAVYHTAVNLSRHKFYFFYKKARAGQGAGVQSIDKADALPSKVCKQTFDGNINCCKMAFYGRKLIEEAAFSRSCGLLMKGLRPFRTFLGFIDSLGIAGLFSQSRVVKGIYSVPQNIS